MSKLEKAIRSTDVKRKKPGEVKESSTFDESNGAAVMELYSGTVRTLDDALKESKVDLKYWIVDRHIINKWDQGSSITVNGERRIAVTQLWQVKIWLTRRVPKVVSDAVEELFSDKKNLKLPPVKRIKQTKKGEPHLFGPMLYDVHFGKYAWKEETGADYDTNISDKLFANAVADMCEYAQPYLIDEVILPIGQDFFHSDNFFGTTHRGTKLDVDTRFQRVFKIGCKAVIRAINQLRQIAPVKVLWVPGNHDRQTSWYLVQVLAARFLNDEDVIIDTGVKKRSYHRYGINLLGFTHGDMLKPDKLPGLMAQEVPELWAATKYRQWLTGHFHKRKQIKYTVGDTVDGVEVITVPSLSGADAWHYEMGFVGSDRASDAYLWGKKTGFKAQFRARARG